jgi:hypothetical protein
MRTVKHLQIIGKAIKTKKVHDNHSLNHPIQEQHSDKCYYLPPYSSILQDTTAEA